MAAIFNSPSKYIQGSDELAKLGSYVEPLGAKAPRYRDAFGQEARRCQDRGRLCRG